MRGYKEPSFQERTAAAARARETALAKLKARPVPSPEELERRAAAAAAKQAADAEKRAAKLAAREAEIAAKEAARREAELAAIADAAQDHGITGRLVPAIDREASPQDAVEMVQWMCAHRCDETIGLGIDYRETDRPPELFAEAYALARSAGFKTTAHAGEFGCDWRNVKTAVELLQVDRIDHGYTIIDAPGFAQQCKERGLVFTVVPTNSYYLRTLPKERWALDHPIRRMREMGLALHPNTDDPTLHHVTPTQAWQMMHRDFGFTLGDLRQCMQSGLKAAWTDDATRRQRHHEFSAGFDELLSFYELSSHM